MKLPNGYGTVYKLSGNRRKPWIARKTTGWDQLPDGKLKQLYTTIGYFEEKADAISALVKSQDCPVVPRANITFEEVYSEWSATKYEYISYQTIDNYKAAWSHLSKYKNVKFKELRTSHIQSVINSCHKVGKGISTLKKIKLVASMLYDYAMENDIVNKNYAEYLVLPKESKEEKESFTDIEVKLAQDSVDKIDWIDTVLILMYTGARITEMLTLTRFSIDLTNKVITGGIKSDAGKDRPIPIHPVIYPIVKKWYDKNGDYLICDENGKAIKSRKYRDDYYHPAIKAAGLRPLNPHSCRHTFASRLSKAGANTVAIQKLMGHVDYALTANTYTHTDMDELRRAINLL